MADNNADKSDKPDLKLTPPPRPANDTADPGARELGDTSESDEHFTDAPSAPLSVTSPIPRTRVEKVSDEPSYGEVPGTTAYQLREGDAEPDEIAVIPDEVEKERQRVRSASIASPPTPGGQPIPKTMLEEAEEAAAAAGEERAHQPPTRRHRADSKPDIVVKRDGSVEMGESSEAGGNESYSTPSPLSPAVKCPGSGRARSSSKDKDVLSPSTRAFSAADDAADDEDGFGDGDGFGDDFDDFEGGQDADFDDFQDGFGEGFEEAEIEAEPSAAAPPPLPAQPSVTSIVSTALPSPKILDMDSLSLTASVPVDLDEILPASKQKKLVLPSVGTPRGSFENRSAARLKNSSANASSTSVDSHGKPKESSNGSRKMKGPVEPKLDLVRAKQLCMTTEAALDNMTDQELGEHIKKLDSLRHVADEALTYWTKKTDEKIGDREAFEGVIENLVKHARKVRK
ncbi:hypothetical protein MKZ38_002823 [Zalerion maritima]|uniref:Uncharacterized protein n=1 Tax=Zalerion maritima TaxID=339359 RepID=A0AAD5RNE1_9PEZI|nr:hypothetical protein MKZ38_002823 [Zalerion maritima]